MFGFIISAALGGAIGAAARFSIGYYWNSAFPYGTMAINIVGSFLMGVLFVVFAEKLMGSSEHLRVFLMTGILGGFTTFSAFSLDIWQMVERGSYVEALSYIGLSVILSVLALILGAYLMQSIVNV